MSFFRILIGIPLAGMITLILFLVMGTLINKAPPELPAATPFPPMTIGPTKTDTPDTNVTDPQSTLPPAPPPPRVDGKATPIDGPILPIPAPNTPRHEKDPDIEFLTGLQGAIITPSPQYPQNCLNKGIEGTATVQFDVTTKGSVINARIVSASHKYFERPALRAIEKWKFTPALGAARGIARHGLVKTFRFKIKQ